ncbi:MAG: molybdopterin-dependent oxidoreductase [Spirochaetaceae bacterium]|nr:molybdopterin-dependent oxidoreductase [Spirochaetaceae bacterium]
MDEERTLAEKLSGRSRFPEDAGGKKTLTGRYLRSTEGNCRIASMNVPDPPRGVVSVLNKDIPGGKRVFFGGESFPVLVGRNILWTGQPILAAAGPDPEVLDEWLTRIELSTHPLKRAVEIPYTEKEYIKGSINQAFSKAFQVVEDIVEVPPMRMQNYPENVTCLKDGATYVIHAVTNWPGSIRRSVSKTLKIPREKILVRPYPRISGTKTRIWQSAVDASRAALLAWKAKKSVRIVFDPQELPFHGADAPGAHIQMRAAVDSEGRIIGLEADVSIEAGSLFPLESLYLERVVMGLFSFYPCRNYVVRCRTSYKEGGPTGFGPAAGFELGFLAGESMASRVAEHSLIPPGSWRRVSFPAKGQAIGPGLSQPNDFPMQRLLERALDISDFERKNAAFEQTRLARASMSRQPEDYRGIGISCAWFGNGFQGSPKEMSSAGIEVTMDKAGQVLVGLPGSMIGGALVRKWTQTAVEILGVEPKDVKFAGELAGGAQDPGPSILGRHVSIYSKLLEQAFNDLAKRRFRDALPITATRTRRRSASRSWNPEEIDGVPFDSTSWGVGIVELTISNRTRIVRPTQIWLVLDGGNLLLPAIARSSVESSAENAMRWCLGNNGYRSTPLMDIDFHPAEKRTQSKDVSTLPWLVLPAAFLQAVRQASGFDISRIPVSPSDIKFVGGTE